MINSGPRARDAAAGRLDVAAGGRRTAAVDRLDVAAGGRRRPRCPAGSPGARLPASTATRGPVAFGGSPHFLPNRTPQLR